MLHMLVALKIATLRSGSRIARLREISKEQLKGPKGNEDVMTSGRTGLGNDNVQSRV